MKKKNILVIFGGCSSEYSVSLSSGTAVIRHLDPEKFEPLMLGITQQGRWLYYTGPVEKILDDTWHTSSFCAPAVLSPSRDDCCLLVQKGSELLRLPVDMAFPVLHGKKRRGRNHSGTYRAGRNPSGRLRHLILRSLHG